MKRITHAIAPTLLVLLLICVFTTILSRGHIIVNRYTDATWHMAVADEFARTGIFAKDPFIPEAPPFAPFGLWDFINGSLQRRFDATPEQVFVTSNAVSCTLFLLASYFAGLLATGRVICGWLSLVTISVTCAMGETTIVRAGWPFALASSFYYLLLGSLCAFSGRVSSFLTSHTVSGIRSPFLLWMSAFGMGLLLGAVFDIHAFVGLFSLAVLCVFIVIATFLAIWRHNARQLIMLAAFAAVGFLAISTPWLSYACLTARHFGSIQRPRVLFGSSAV